MVMMSRLFVILGLQWLLQSTGAVESFNSFPSISEFGNNDIDVEFVEEEDWDDIDVFPSTEELSQFEIMTWVPGDDVDYYLRFPNDSPIQSHDYAKGALSLNDYPKFDDVNVSSLDSALRASVSLCINYKNRKTGEIFTYRGNGFYFNSTHILTSRHNIHECMLQLEGSKLMSCDGMSKRVLVKAAQHYKSPIFDLESILALDIYNPHICHSDSPNDFLGNFVIDMNSVVRYDKDLKSKRDDISYWMKSAHINDFAIMKGPSENGHAHITIDPKMNFKSMVDGKEMSNLRFVLIGFAARFNPKKKYYVTNYEKSNGQKEPKFLSGDEMNYLFKHGTFPAFATGTGLKYDIVDELLIHHQIPTYGGYSGSCVFYVADNGNLIPIALHVGAVGQNRAEWNGAMLFSHEFMECHVTNTDKGKDEL